LRPFSTNPFLSGLVLGIAIRQEEEKSSEKSSDDDQLLYCTASAMGAKGDQIFWNTWLQFSALLAFFVTWRYQVFWGPFLIPLVFSLLALPVRFLGIFWGYKNGISSISGRFNALLLGLRRRLQTLILFSQGLLTAFVLDSMDAHDGIASAPTLFFASAFFLSILLGIALFRLYPRFLTGIYILEIGILFLLLSYI
jgi:mannose/fructose/N-acetylgalactosamine-specific phosphotransferase system component IID